MANDNKVLTRAEVNDLVAGTFSEDLNKAVLYGELSGKTEFVVNQVNHVTNLNYAENQALLSAAVRRSGSIRVTVSAQTPTVLSTGTQVVFDIDIDSDEPIVGTPSYSILVSTYDGQPATATFNAGHTQLTVTFPANSSYDTKDIEVQVRVTLDGNDFDSNVGRATQNAAGRLEFNPASGSVHSTAVTANAAYLSNCTNVGISGTSGLTGQSINDNAKTVTMNFTKNSDTSGPKSKSITITGKTPDDVTTSATYTLEQAAGLNVGMSFTYADAGTDLTPASGEIPSNKFTVTLTNAILTNATADNGMTVTTGGTPENPTISVTYPSNSDTANTKDYTITLTATDIYDNPITASVTITQEEDAWEISLTPPVSQVQYNDTTATLGLSYSGLSSIAFDSEHSDVLTCTNPQGENSVDVTFPQNHGSQKTLVVTLSGTTRGGNPVSGYTSFTQTAAQSGSITVTITTDQVAASVTTNTFSYLANSAVDPATIGWDSGTSVGITSCTVDTGACTGTCSFVANTSYTADTLTLALSGTTLLSEDVSGSTSFEHLRVEVTPELSISGGNVGATSGTIRCNVTSSYVDTIDGYSVNGTGASLGTTGQSYADVNYGDNQSASQRTFDIIVSGTDVYGELITASTSITQSAAGALTFLISYSGTGNVSAASGETSAFTVSVQNATVTGFTVSGGSGSEHATAHQGNTGVTIEYPANQDPTNTVTYTVTMAGYDEFNNPITTSTTFTQNADSTTFSIGAPNVQANATSNTISVTQTNVSDIGFDASNSDNRIVGATGNTIEIPMNSGPQTDYAVYYTGTSVGGRTVSATTTFTQYTSRGSFQFQSDTTAEATATSKQVTFTYAYLSGNQVAIQRTSNNVWFDANHTQASTTVNVTPNHASTNGQLTVYFENNTGSSSKEMTIKSTSVVGEGGKSIADDTLKITQNSAAATSLSITYDGTNVSAASGTTNDFTISANNVTVTGYTVDNGASVIASGVSSVTIEYPANSSGATKEYKVWVRGKNNEFSTEVVSEPCTITQQASRSEFKFENDKSVGAADTNVTVNFSYKYLSDSTISMTVSGGAYFDANKTQTTTTVNVTSGASSGNGSVSIYFNTNTGSGSRTFTVSASTVHGEAGEALPNDDIKITQPAESGVYITVTPVTQNLSWDSTSAEFHIEWAGLKSSGLTITTDASGGPSPASMSGGSDSGNTTITFSKNDTYSSITHTIYVSAESQAGASVTANGSVTQPAAPVSDLSVSAVTTPSPVSSGATSVQFRVTWVDVYETISLSANTGTLSTSAITASGSGNQIITITMGANSGDKRTITLSALTTGTTDEEITKEASIVQKGPDGEITVTPASGEMSYQASSVTFSVAWSNLKSNSTISLSKNANITSISQDSINTASATSPVIITASVPENSGNSARDAILEASGTGANDESVTGTGKYTQASTPRGTLTVKRYPDINPIPFSSTAQTFTVSGTNLSSKTVQLTVFTNPTGESVSFSSVSGSQVTTTSITLDENDEGEVTIYFDVNTYTGETQSITYTVSGTATDIRSQTVSGSDSISQSPMFNVQLYFDTGYTNHTVTVSGATTSLTLTYWHYNLAVVPTTIQIDTHNGAYLNSNMTTETSYKILQKTLYLAPVSGTTTIYFNQNNTQSDRTYTCEISVFGGALSDSLTIIHNPTPTTGYNLTFDIQQTGDTLVYSVNGGQAVTATSVSYHTVPGLSSGDVVTYTLSKANYITMTDSTTMGNSDKIVRLGLIDNDFWFAINGGTDGVQDTFTVEFFIDSTGSPIEQRAITVTGTTGDDYHFHAPNDFVLNGNFAEAGDFKYYVVHVAGGTTINDVLVTASETSQTSGHVPSMSDANSFMSHMTALKARHVVVSFDHVQET